MEDNMINVKVIKRQLALKGYLVSVAMDGREALNILYSDASETSELPPINIVLMDIQMPSSSDSPLFLLDTLRIFLIFLTFFFYCLHTFIRTSARKKDLFFIF